MSELYRHLLIPQSTQFAPERSEIVRFFDEMATLGALPKEANFMVVILTGKKRAYARNPSTGEAIYGPEMIIKRSSELKQAIDCVGDADNFDLSADGVGPTAIPAFELYSADNYALPFPGALVQKTYEFTVRCRVRDKVTHVLRSGFDCDCDLKPDEPAIFENPWNHAPIQTGALGGARFWIEFGIGDYLMPMVTDTLDILDRRLVEAANHTFGIEFQQGCIRNDD